MAGRKQADDAPGKIEARLAEYRAESKELVAAHPGIRLLEVDANRPAAEDYKEIKALLKIGK